MPTHVPDPIRARAINAFGDAFIAAYGRFRLNPGQYHTLMRAYWHAITFT